MNTENQNITSPTVSKRRNGHVARLPKVLRDQVNTMLDDGVPYSEIVTELDKSTDPPLPHAISVDNITRWKEGGYQDYLKAQDWRDRVTLNADRLLDIGSEDPTKVAASGLYAAIIQISYLLDEFAKPTAGETDAQKCTRMSHALSRLSQSILTIQKYRDKLAKENPKRSKGGLTKEQTAEIIEAMRML
jgi:hypothetical protein